MWWGLWLFFGDAYDDDDDGDDDDDNDNDGGGDSDELIQKGRGVMGVVLTTI